MTPVCTIDYINRPGKPGEDIIIAHVRHKNGWCVPADLVQWVRLPDRRFPTPMPAAYRHPDGMTLEKVRLPEAKYALYCSYDAQASRIFWMVADAMSQKAR